MMSAKNITLRSVFQTTETIFFTVVGTLLAVHAVKVAIYLVSDLAWRIPRGYVYWDMHGGLASYTLSIVSLAAACFILANALLHWRMSRRAKLWVVGLVVAGVLLFIVAAGFLLSGLSGLGEF